MNEEERQRWFSLGRTYEKFETKLGDLENGNGDPWTDIFITIAFSLISSYDDTKKIIPIELYQRAIGALRKEKERAIDDKRKYRLSEAITDLKKRAQEYFGGQAT